MALGTLGDSGGAAVGSSGQQNVDGAARPTRGAWVFSLAELTKGEGRSGETRGRCTGLSYSHKGEERVERAIEAWRWRTVPRRRHGRQHGRAGHWRHDSDLEGLEHVKWAMARRRGTGEQVRRQGDRTGRERVGRVVEQRGRCWHHGEDQEGRAGALTRASRWLQARVCESTAHELSTVHGSRATEQRGREQVVACTCARRQSARCTRRMRGVAIVRTARGDGLGDGAGWLGLG